MENSKKSFRSTWTTEQSGTISTIEQKYRKCIYLTNMQGLKIDEQELKAQKCREIKAILTYSQFKSYLNIR